MGIGMFVCSLYFGFVFQDFFDGDVDFVFVVEYGVEFFVFGVFEVVFVGIFWQWYVFYFMYQFVGIFYVEFDKFVDFWFVQGFGFDIDEDWMGKGYIGVVFDIGIGWFDCFVGFWIDDG